MVAINKIDLDLIISKAKISSGMVVGDFGCGSGFLTKKVAKIVTSKGLVYAVDVMKDSLLQLLRNLNSEGIQNVKTIWSNLELYRATKISDNVMNVGFLVNVLFQSNQENDILKEIGRMVKVGGHIVIVDWKKGVDHPIAPDEKASTDIEKVRDICKNLRNLKEVEYFEPGDSYWGVILEKTS